MKIQSNLVTIENNEGVAPESANWIKNRFFVLDNFYPKEKEEEIINVIEAYGGVVRDSFYSNTNYLVYDTDYGITTYRMESVKKLIEKGKTIQIITKQQFWEMVELLPIPNPDFSVIPHTHKECEQIFKGKANPEKGIYTIYGSKMDFSTLIIPGIIDGLPVRIKNGSFNNNNNLKTLIFSDGYIEIGDNCFNNCINLKNITFSSTKNNFCSNRVFENSLWIKNQGDWFILNNVLISYLGEGPIAVIPYGVEQIGDKAFSRSSVRKVIIPSTVRTLGSYAFAFCSALKEINIPSGIEELPSRLFEYCTALEQITLPSTITTIGNRVFGGCRSMKTINIPDKVCYLGNEIFLDCFSLKEITIPSGIEELPYGMFDHCVSLERATLPSTIESIEGMVFNKCSKINIYAPKGCYAEKYAENNSILFTAL